jgi:uncharacterized protein (TIGR02246 family)
MNANEKAVAEVLAKYQDALNQSDTAAVMKLYASDGVFMPQNSPSSVGTGEVRKAYDAVFKTIRLSVQFNVAKVVEMAPNWVFARTNSAGTVKVHATARAVWRPIRSFSCFRRSMEPGRSHATAFPQPTRHPHKE